MKAVIFPGDRKVRIDERDVPEPGLGQVLVRTRASAICRSDMSLYVGNTTIVGSWMNGLAAGLPPGTAQPAPHQQRQTSALVPEAWYEST